jgi:predicted Kef-type K+ transport protein
VGLHFSLKDLMAVKSIAIPGAIAQIGVATLLGMALSAVLGWSLMTGIVFGLCLSTASTVVLLRALEERQLIDSQRGQIAIGWLIVEEEIRVLKVIAEDFIKTEHIVISPHLYYVADGDGLFTQYVPDRAIWRQPGGWGWLAPRAPAK